MVVMVTSMLQLAGEVEEVETGKKLGAVLVVQGWRRQLIVGLACDSAGTRSMSTPGVWQRPCSFLQPSTHSRRPQHVKRHSAEKGKRSRDYTNDLGKRTRNSAHGQLPLDDHKFAPRP